MESLSTFAKGQVQPVQVSTRSDLNTELKKNEQGDKKMRRSRVNSHGLSDHEDELSLLLYPAALIRAFLRLNTINNNKTVNFF